jgi:hypothetical protein
MTNPTRYALAALTGFAALSGTAHASEADFLKRFHGSFAGNGQVRMEQGEAPHTISCKVSGTSTASTVNIGGTCSAGMMSKNISASLKTSGNGRYTGTFNGIKGSASLSGRRQGNSIVLAVSGKEPATMTISNSGAGISLTVTANKTQMTSVRLARAGGAGPQLASVAE